MRFELGAFFNPFSERQNFLGREALIGLRRRHHFLIINVGDASDQFAFVRCSGFNDFESGPPLIEPQFSFACFGIGTVAGEALIRKDGADITIERELSSCAESAEEENDGNNSHGQTLRIKRKFHSSARTNFGA